MIPDDKYFCFEKTILLFTLFWYAGQPCSFPYSTDVNYQSPIIFFIESELNFFLLIFRAQLFFSTNFRARLFFYNFIQPPPPGYMMVNALSPVLLRLLTIFGKLESFCPPGGKSPSYPLPSQKKTPKIQIITAQWHRTVVFARLQRK